MDRPFGPGIEFGFDFEGNNRNSTESYDRIIV